MEGKNLKKNKSGNVKKMCLPGTDKLTQAVDRKPSYFSGWPEHPSIVGPGFLLRRKNENETKAHKKDNNSKNKQSMSRKT